MTLELNENQLLGDSYIIRESLSARRRELRKMKKDLKAVGMQPSNLLDHELVQVTRLWKKVIELRGDTDFDIT